jgi:hypothetical protein
VLTAQRKFAGDVRGKRSLTHAAFLVEQSDDHEMVLHDGKRLVDRPGKCGDLGCGYCCCFKVSAVVHCNGVALLPVIAFRLGKLEAAQIRVVTGFAADFVA